MEFLNSITLSEMKTVCFDESIEIFCDNNMVGEWNICLKEAKSLNSLEFTTKFHIKTEDGIGGTEIHAVLGGHLKTIEQEKYEYFKAIGLSYERKTILRRKPGGDYDISCITVKNRVKSEMAVSFCARDMQGFIGEAAGLVLQRVMSHRQCKDIIILCALNQNCFLCDVTYIPVGVEVVHLQKLDFKVFVIQGELRTKGKETIQWTSYYHNEGLLMFYSQDGCPLYCLIPKPSDKVDSKFGINLQEKHGARYLYTIGEDDIKKLLFSEAKRIQFGSNFGIFNVSVKMSQFNGESCLLVHVHSFVTFTEGHISSTITSHLNLHLETLDYIQHDFVERQQSQNHNVFLIYRNDDVNVGTFNFSKKAVSRENSKFTENEFSDFISKASAIVLHRLLVLRNLDRNLTFITLCDKMNRSKVIFRPLINESTDQENPVFGLEHAVIPEMGKISIWKQYFNHDGTLVSSTECGYPMQIEDSPLELLPKSEIDGATNVFRGSQLFRSGSEFLHTVDVDDILFVLFDENMKVTNMDDVEVGHVNVQVENCLNNENKHIMVYLNSVIHSHGKTFRTSITGKLSASLDTLEQTMEKNIAESWDRLVQKKTFIQKLYSQYSVTETLTVAGKTTVVEKIVESHCDMPFISETASILLERLIVRKKVPHSLKFFTLHSDLTKCIIRYHSLPREWWIVGDMKCEVFCYEKNVVFLQEDESKEILSKTHSTLYFSQTGYSIERSQAGHFEKMVPSIQISDDVDHFPLLPMDINHDPPFATYIDLSEIKSVLFDDDLTIVSENGDELGHYYVTVDHVKYKSENAFLVCMNLLAKIEDDFCGSTVTAYLNLNLEIMDFRKVEFIQNKGRKAEKSVSFSKVYDGYIVQCMKSENSVVSRDLKKWCASQERLYVCDASSVLIQRLMVLRNTQDSLDFITFDMSGNACNMQFVRKGMKPLNVNEQEFDVIQICVSVDSNEGPDANFKTLFTRTGFAILYSQEGVDANLMHLSLQKNKKTKLPMDFLHAKDSASLPPFVSNLTSKVLHSFDSYTLEAILGPDELCILSNENTEVGKLSLHTSSVQYKGQHCLLVELNVATNIENTELITKTTDLLLPNLELVKHKHKCFFKTADFCAEKSIFLEKKGGTFCLKQTLKHNENPEVLINTVICSNIQGFVSEASCFLFQKILAKRNMSGQYQFISVDTSRNLCNVRLRTLGHKIENIDGEDVRICGIEIEITPFQKCSRSWRSYFDENGVLVSCKPIGLPLLLQKSHYTTSNVLDSLQPDYSVVQGQVHFLNSLAPKEFDSLLRSEYAHIIYKGQAQLGDFIVFCDSIHYGDQHCISVFMSSLIEVRDETCATTIYAILSKRLEILTYVFHEYVTPNRDKKMFISLQDGSYKIEMLNLEDGKITENELDISCCEVPLLCCEAVAIIIVYLIVQKRTGYSLEFLGVDNNGNLCQTYFRNVGIRSIRVSGIQMQAWKVINRTAYSDGSEIVWEYSIAEDGRLVRRQQIGTPITIAAPREICEKYKF